MTDDKTGSPLRGGTRGKQSMMTPHPPLLMSTVSAGCEAGVPGTGTEQFLAQAGGEVNKIADDRTEDGRAGAARTPLVRRGCQHDKRGYCTKHGWGARRLERRVSCVTTDPGGKKVKSYKKKPYFECDLGPNGRGVLRQTQLSFLRTPTLTGLGGEDVAGEGASTEAELEFSSTTVGQAGKD